MKLINELVQELIDISQDFQADNDLEARNLNLDLLIHQVENIQIDFSKHPLDNIPEEVKRVFNNLLKRHIYKAKCGLIALKDTTNKRKYNAVARTLVAKKLFFSALNRTMTRNIEGYADRNKLTHVEEFQILTGGMENE